MSFTPGLAIVLASLLPAATADAPTVLREIEVALSAYQRCLFREIDRQHEDARSAFSETRVISNCVGTRREEVARAAACLAEGRWSAGAARTLVHRRFAELDESVWTIVGHLRARRASREQIDDAQN